MDFLSEIAKKLDLPPGEKAEVLKELESHYREVEDELTASGMDEREVATEAGRRLGDPQDVASRLQTVHCQATWRTAWLTAFPLVVKLVIFLLSSTLVRVVLGTHAHKSAMYSYQMSLVILAAVCGVFFLAGSIRELVRNRRPIWLATWLAVGIHELFTAAHWLGDLVKWGEGISMSRVDLSPSVMFFILMVGLTSTIAYRRSAKWLAILGAWTVGAEVIYLAVPWASFTTGSFIVFISLVCAPFMMSVALGLFARHPYGNTSQSSLFLFAYYIGISSYSGDMSWWGFAVLNLLSPLVIVGTVIAYARSATWWQKLAILAGGIVATSLARQLNPFSADLALGMVFMLVWVILVPMLFDRRWSDRRPEMVR